MISLGTFLVIGVSTKPGRIALHLMPNLKTARLLKTLEELLKIAIIMLDKFIVHFQFHSPN